MNRDWRVYIVGPSGRVHLRGILPGFADAENEAKKLAQEFGLAMVYRWVPQNRHPEFYYYLREGA